MARARLGQHFLEDSRAIEKIIGALELAPGETVIEVGPGHGELTAPLARRAEETGCRVVAVEKDPALSNGAALRGLCEKFPCIAIEKSDIREFLQALSKNPLPSHYKITGNIPYYLTGFLFRKISELRERPLLAVFTVQREVAERIMALAPRMNKLSASIRFWADPQIVAMVPKESFRPQPKVDSAIIKLATKTQDAGLSESYYALLNILFRQPRKTIFNNLFAAFKETNSGTTKENILKKIAEAGLRPEDRPQDLSVRDIESLAKLF